jgi:hypothetical protein
MGFRTLVLLSNDRCNEWGNDPLLGAKISGGMNDAMGSMHGPNANLGYGRVVECTHADTVTLAVVDSLQFRPLVHSFWNREDLESTNLRMVKAAAEELGYRLVKKSGNK